MTYEICLFFPFIVPELLQGMWLEVEVPGPESGSGAHTPPPGSSAALPPHSPPGGRRSFIRSSIRDPSAS